MRPRASQISLIGEMRRMRAARWLALAVLLMAGGTQLTASWHEMAVRHVLCAAHGELTHVKVAATTAASGAQRDQEGSSSYVSPLPTEAADGHEHCAVALIVQSGIQAPSAPVATACSPPPAAIHLTPVALPTPGRSTVLASAPKTSPPSV
ncbi:MAG TPA: hypothetical protein VNO55_10315 [Polyangia bacterium]|nr:hypothetical protein [Polyangia bacterium]